MWDAEQHDTLDVDRFPWSYALEPREAPSWTGIVWMGAGGEVKLNSYSHTLSGEKGSGLFEKRGLRKRRNKPAWS